MSSWCLGFLGASTLPVNVNPRRGQGKGEAYFRETSGEGGPLLLSTGKLCHGEQNCTRRPERGGGWQGSDTSSRFKGPKPGHLLAAPPSLPPSTAFSSGFSLPPSALFIFSLLLRKGWGGWRGGERKRMNLVISVEPSLAKPMVTMLEFSATERCTF